MKNHINDMSPVKIKYLMDKAGISQAALARKLGVTQPSVNGVIKGKSTSHKIRKAIADVIDRDVKEIWPTTYIMKGGPQKPGRPRTDQIV